MEMNRDAVSGGEYREVCNALIAALTELKSPDGAPLMNWAKTRHDADSGGFSENIYPDLLFELANGYGVGWELDSGLYGKSTDHQVASGGHAKDAVLLLRNIDRKLRRDTANVVDVTPTMLDLFGVDWRSLGLDGVSLFAP